MIQILLADNDQVFCSVLRSVDKTLAERAEAFASTREERAEGCFVRPPSNGFSCLIHNDAYCHNFMFRFQSRKRWFGLVWFYYRFM